MTKINFLTSGNGGSNVNYMVALNGVSVGDHKIKGSGEVRKAFLDSGTTFTYFPVKLWNSIIYHLDYFCRESENIRRRDGQKKYCNGKRFRTNVDGNALVCFEYDRHYFEGRDGPGRKHFFLGFPMIRIHMSD